MDRRRFIFGLGAGVAGVTSAAFSFKRRSGERRDVRAKNELILAQHKKQLEALSPGEVEMMRRGVREHMAGVFDPESDSLKYLIDQREWETDALCSRRVETQKLALTDPSRVFFADQNAAICGVLRPSGTFQTEDEKRAWVDFARIQIAAQFPTVRLSLDNDNEEPRAFFCGGAFTDKKWKSHLDATWEYSQKTVGGKETTKLAFAKRKIAEVLQAEGVPQTEAQELARLMAYGLAGVESYYNNDAESPEGAKGTWQFIEAKAREFGLFIGKRKVKEQIKKRGRLVTVTRTKKVDERFDFAKATGAAAKYMASLYKKFVGDETVRKICQDYGVAFSDFVIPCAINSYNSGDGNILSGKSQEPDMIPMIRWFAAKFTPAKVRKFLGSKPLGKNLFAFMSMAYAKSGHNADYGPDSREYYFRVAAMADLMEETEKASGTKPVVAAPSTYKPPQRPPVHFRPAILEPGSTLLAGERLTDATSAALLSVGAIVAAEAVAHTAAVTRRGFFGIFGRATQGVAVSAIAASAGHVTGYGLADISTSVDPSGSDKMKEEPERALPELHQAAVLQGMQQRRIALKMQSPKQSEINKGKARKNPYLVALCKLLGMRAMETDAQIQQANEDQPDRFLSLFQETHLYRAVQIGSNDDKINNPEYMRMFPEATDAVTELSKEFNRLAHEAGLPAEYSLRILVSAATRSQEYQRRLSGGGNENATEGITTHAFRNSFDVPFRIDIVGPEGYAKVRLPGGEWAKADSYTRSFSETEKLKTLLIRAAINLSRRGILLYRDESGSKQPCLHVMAVSPEAGLKAA